MKIILLISVFVFSMIDIKAQQKDTTHHYVITSIQLQQSVTQAPYSQLTATIGFTSDKCDQFGVGGVVRTYYTGERQKSCGVTGYGQSGVLYPIIIAVKFDVIYGTWYKEYDLHRPGNVIKVRDFQGFASMTFSMPIKKGLYLGAEINSAAYNPRRYFKENKEPFNWFGVGFSMKKDFIF